MDIDRDESQPFDRLKDPDAMDISLDLSVNDERMSKIDDPSSKPGDPANQDAKDLLDRPREEESGPATVDQDGKTLSRLFVAVATELGLT